MKLKMRKKMAGCLVAGWFATSLACLAPPVGYGQETAQSKAKMQPLPMLTKAFGATLDTPVVYQATSAEQSELLNHAVAIDSGVDESNVKTLQKAWVYPTQTPVSHAALLNDGAIYFGDYGGSIYKLDAKTGAEIWVKRDLQKPMNRWPWQGFVGTGAIADGVLVEASAEGMAYGLEPATGDVLWESKISLEEHSGAIGKILSYGPIVYIGITSVEEALDKMMKMEDKPFEPDFLGSVVALNAKTGEIIWRRMLAEAPSNGAGMWSSFALDAESATLFFTTSNSYTGEASPLSDAVVAVDARSGDIRWSKQVISHDTWTPVRRLGPDFAFGAGAQLFEAKIDGEKRELVGAGNKSGFFYVYDRKTGEPVYETVLGYSGIEGGLMGEVSIGKNNAFAWSNNGYFHEKPPEMIQMSVLAFDLSTGKVAWAVEMAQPAALRSAGLLTGGVYLTPSLDGKVRAYRAADGSLLWASDKHGPVISSLTAQMGMIYFGTGAPPVFGDWAKGAKHGMVAYRVPPSDD